MSVTLSWRLTAAGGAPLPGRVVTVLRRDRGTRAWRPIREMRTDAAGRVSLTTSVVVNSEFAIRHSGATPATGVISRPVVVDAPAIVSSRLSAVRVRRGERAALAGLVLAGSRTRPVELQQLTNRAWRTIATTRPDGTGRYTFVLPTGTRGLLKFRVHRPADAQNTAGYGQTHALSVV